MLTQAFMLTEADLVWNRACQGGGENPQEGDRALAALLLFHGPAMNGGVLHAAECLNADSINAAAVGFQYFGFAVVAQLVRRAKQISEAGQDLEQHEQTLDEQYWRHIGDDSVLVRRFEEHFETEPSAFAPNS